jgi:hypothetical protein
VNTAGVIPADLRVSLLLLPTTLLGLWANQGPDWLQAFAGQLQHGRPLFMLLYGALIVFFCFFYTSIIFNPEETAENLRKHGGFLPGIRPGKRTGRLHRHRADPADGHRRRLHHRGLPPAGGAERQLRPDALLRGTSCSSWSR